MSPITAISEVTQATFSTEVIEASRARPVVVDFWAPWCGPCHQLSPILQRVADRFADDVRVVKLNVDEAPAIARQFGVQGVPAVKAFRDGAVAAEFTGVQPEPAVERFFAALVPSEADRLAAAAAISDPVQREAGLQRALEADPGHREAILGLAELYAERGEAGAARALLERLPADPDAQRLLASLNLAAARLDEGTRERLQAAAAAGDVAAALSLGRGLAAEGDHEQGLAFLLAAVRAPDQRDDARDAMLEVFRLLGDDHETVRAYRPRLASALF